MSKLVNKGTSLRQAAIVLFSVAIVFLRTAPAWSFAQVNLLDYSSPGNPIDRTGEKDISQALTAAIIASNEKGNKNISQCIYIPSGSYRVKKALPSFTNGGCVVGDGLFKSIIILDKDFTGDLFSWSNSWVAGVFSPNYEKLIDPIKVGARVEHLTISSDRDGTSVQNAVVLYDHNDFVTINDVDFFSIRGHAIYAGVNKNGSASYMRESRISNIRAFASGSSSNPVIEITSQCTSYCVGQDASNEIDLSNIDIYAPIGSGLVIRNAQPRNSGTVRQIRLSKLRIEGKEGSPSSFHGDLFVIGDSVMEGQVARVSCSQCELVSSYVGCYAMRVDAVSMQTSPYSISFEGLILRGGGKGGGVNLQAVSQFSFIGYLQTADIDMLVRSNTTVQGPIYLNGLGTEGRWKTKIDDSAQNLIVWANH